MGDTPCKSCNGDSPDDSGLRRLRGNLAKLGRMTGDKNNSLTIAILAAVLSGGGVSALLPKAAPGWFRPDPATGSELREMRRELDALKRDFREFLKEGPREVRRAQDAMLRKLDRLLEELKERGEEHKQWHKRAR